MLTLVLVFILALGAGALGGLVGTGSSLVLLPVLVLLYGPRVAVPMMAIAAVMANVGRVAAWWREIRWRPVFVYSATGAPAAVLGAHTADDLSEDRRWALGCVLSGDDSGPQSNGEARVAGCGCGTSVSRALLWAS